MVALGCPHPVSMPSYHPTDPFLSARPMIGIRVLGTFTVQLPDGSAPVVVLTQPKLMALLLYLVLAEPAGPQSRDSLLALLWPEADVESARHSLRHALYRLRQTLCEGAGVSRRGG